MKDRHRHFVTFQKGNTNANKTYGYRRLNVCFCYLHEKNHIEKSKKEIMVLDTCDRVRNRM